MPYRRTARLARWQKWLLCLAGGGLWLSGCGWLLLHYYGRVQGAFGPETNPAEPWLMRLHGLALIPALLGIGGMFVVHIPKGWTHARQRVAGVALCTILGILILSGYLLYYLGDEDARSWASVAHWMVGLGLPAIFLWHWLNGIAARKR